MNRRYILLAAVATLALFTFIALPLAGRTLAQAAKPDLAPGIASRVLVQIEIPDDLGPDQPRVHALPAIPEQDILQLAADALGMSRDELLAAREEGRTLDDLAREHDTTKAKVVEAIEGAMMASHRAAIEDAVADGTLDREVADRLLEGLTIELELDDLPAADVSGGRLLGHLGPLELSLAHVLGDRERSIHLRALEEGSLLVERDLDFDDLELEDVELGAFSWFHEPLDEATVDAVTEVLQDAVRDGRLTQAQVDRALERLEPAPAAQHLERIVPAIKLLRLRDEAPDAGAAPDAKALDPQQPNDPR